MHNAIAHHPPTDPQPIPKQWLPPRPAPPVLCLQDAPGTGYPRGQPGPAVLAAFPSPLLTHPWAA